MVLTDKQKGVLRGILPALAATAFALAAAPLAFGGQAETQEARASLAAASSLAPLAALLLHIGAIARQRFFSPEDIDGGGLTSGSGRILILSALLQNTLEQAALAIGVYWTFTMLAPAGWLAALPAAAALFLIGRALFAVGYARGAPARALGFGLTFYPTAGLLLASALAMFIA